MLDGRNDQGHWSDLYRTRAVDEVSWYQPVPTVSLELIAEAGVHDGSAIIDVGGGASSLPEDLLRRGYRDLTVLDVAGPAIAAARRRLGDRADQVRWIEADLLQWRPDRRYDLWHDRAVFHFLTDQAERERYLQTLRAALAPTGAVVIGTFAADGPDHCSGLPTSRYDPDQLAARFPGFDLVTSRREQHHTPAGVRQPFTWTLLRRVS
jgi:SAM-dependent methyltransferase